MTLSHIPEDSGGSVENRNVVLVCGGRDFTDAVAVDRVLSLLHASTPITRIIHGAARGADSLAAAWASVHRIPVGAFPADWERYGKAAGPRRNRFMLTHLRPSLVVAFPGGKGTEHMVSIAKKARVNVIEVAPATPSETRCAKGENEDG